MIKTYYINSTQALYDDVEFAWLQSLVLEEGVLGDSAGTLGLQVTQSGTPGMSVSVAAGKALVEITKSGRTFKVVVENDAAASVVIPANSSGANRVGAVIVRVDVDTEPNVLKNNVGTIEYIPGDDTSPLSDGDITAAVGSDGWLRLANVTVENAETTILNADISDQRTKVQLNDAVEIPIDALSDTDTTQAAVDQSQTGSANSTAVGATDGAGERRRIAQSFIPTKRGISSVRLFKKANTGSFTGDVVVSVQADVSGSPSGTPLATVTIPNARWADIANDSEFEAFFTTQYDGFVIGATYWIVVIPSTGDSSNCANLGAQNANPYANGVLKYWNTTDSWTLVSNVDLYFKTVEINATQIVKTNSEGDIPAALLPAGAILYTNFTPGSSTSSSNSYVTYVNQIIKGAFRLNGGIKIRLFFNYTCGNSTNEGQNIRLALNGTELFNFDVSPANVTDGPGATGYLDVYIRNTGAMNTQEWMYSGMANSGNAQGTGNSNTQLVMGSWRNNGTSSLDLTANLATLLIQMRNNDTDANLNHQFLGVIIEKWGY